MNNAADAPARPVFYAVAVRGLRGRKWFAADSAQCGDRAFVAANVAELTAMYPGLRFAAMDTREIGGIAPKHYRPWDTDADETDDVDMDALSDAEL